MIISIIYWVTQKVEKRTETRISQVKQCSQIVNLLMQEETNFQQLLLKRTELSLKQPQVT